MSKSEIELLMNEKCETVSIVEKNQSWSYVMVKSDNMKKKMTVFLQCTICKKLFAKGAGGSH